MTITTNSYTVYIQGFNTLTIENNSGDGSNITSINNKGSSTKALDEFCIH